MGSMCGALIASHADSNITESYNSPSSTAANFLLSPRRQEEVDLWLSEHKQQAQKTHCHDIYSTLRGRVMAVLGRGIEATSDLYMPIIKVILELDKREGLDTRNCF